VGVNVVRKLIKAILELNRGGVPGEEEIHTRKNVLFSGKPRFKVT